MEIRLPAGMLRGRGRNTNDENASDEIADADVARRKYSRKDNLAREIGREASETGRRHRCLLYVSRPNRLLKLINREHKKGPMCVRTRLTQLPKKGPLRVQANYRNDGNPLRVRKFGLRTGNLVGDRGNAQMEKTDPSLNRKFATPCQ